MPIRINDGIRFWSDLPRILYKLLPGGAESIIGKELVIRKDFAKERSASFRQIRKEKSIINLNSKNQICTILYVPHIMVHIIWFSEPTKNSAYYLI